MKNDDRLLRECVKAILTEDDGYGGIMGAAAEMSPFGMHYASKDQLYNAFVKPFVDVFDVAKGKTKEMSQRALTAVSVAYKAVATSVLPFLSQDYEELFVDQKKKIEQIREEYADVYDASWDALKQNDIVWCSFLAAPGAFLTARLAAKAPEKIANMLSVLSGGEMDPFLEKLKKKKGKKYNPDTMGTVHHSGGKNAGYDMYGDGLGSYYESVIRESDGEPSFAEVLTSKKVLAKALGSPRAQRIAATSRDTIRSTLKGAYDKASTVMKANSLQDIQKMVGRQLKGADALQKVDQNERAKAEQQLLIGVKKSCKELYAKELEAHVNDAIKAGVPEDSPVIDDYRSTIRKIRAL